VVAGKVEHTARGAAEELLEVRSREVAPILCIGGAVLHQHLIRALPSAIQANRGMMRSWSKTGSRQGARAGAPFVASAFALVLGLSACGGTGHGTVANGGAAAGSAAAAAGTGATVGQGGAGESSSSAGREPSAGSAGRDEPGAGGAASDSEVVSEPDAVLTNAGKPTSGVALEGLTVTHSHFYVDPQAQPAGTWTWLAVVKSQRSDLACELSVEGDLLADGSAPIKIFAKVAAPPYRQTGTSSVFRCIAPGEVGVASGSALQGVPGVAPESVTEIKYAITGVLSPTLIPGDWVTLSGVEVGGASGSKVVRGTLTNGSSTMPWWEVDIYPVDHRGLPLTEFVLSDARAQLPAGATWDFETPAYEGDFSDAHTFVRHSGAK
jgi:hypothetical protein